MLIRIFIILAFLSARSLAGQTLVNSMTELSKLVKKASPGSVFLLEDGVYHAELTLIANGIAGDSIYLAPENSGKVIIKGNLGLRGSFLVIEGFEFRNPDSLRSTNVRTNTAIHCLGLTNSRISNNKFVEIGRKSQKTTDEVIRMNNGSSDNIISNNTWTRSNAIGIYVTPDSKNVLIEKNQFLNTGDAGGNRWEYVKINSNIERGDSSTNTVVKNNLFYNYVGDKSEVISIKCSNNYILNNVFIKCVGDVTTRVGNSCTIAGNVFIESAGIRLAGKNHQVINNHFFNSTSNAIKIMKGDSAKIKPNYVAGSDLKILNNSIYEDVLSPILIGFGGDRLTVTPHNLFFFDNTYALGKRAQEVSEDLKSDYLHSKFNTFLDSARFDRVILEDLIREKAIPMIDSLGFDSGK